VEADLEVLVSGRGLVESPRWHDGRIWFSDWIAGEIIAVDDTTPAGDAAGVEVVVRHQSLPLCFDFTPDGRLVLVSNQAMALLVLEPTGDLATYADLSHLSPYGNNDIVIDSRGNAYVNSGNFDFATGPPDGERQPGYVALITPDGERQPGYVALITPDGSARIVADDIAFPNGMAVTTDNRTLLVADSYRHQMVGFDIDADGALSGRRVWADLGDAAPDGICLDADGAAWYADVPHEECVRVAEGGERLATVALDRGGFACMLGGADRSVLYVVAARWPGMAGLGGDWDWQGQLLRVPLR
jgi:sugar lactone lactonase YvrE